MQEDWVVLELSPRSEGEDPDILSRGIRNSLKIRDAEVFVPATVTQVGEDRAVHYLVEGYVFVRYTGNPTPFFRSEGTRYVQSVLRDGEGRLSLVANSEILGMREKLYREVDQGIGIGDRVLICSGPYQNIEATVIEDIPEQGKVQVYVKLRSKQTILTLPRPFLQVVERTPLSAYFSRLTALRGWTRQVRLIFKWPADRDKVVRCGWETLELLDNWDDFSSKRIAFIKSFHRDTRMALLRDKLGKLSQLDEWVRRSSSRFVFVRACWRNDLDRCARTVQDKLVELCWFDDVLDRINSLQKEVEVLAHRVAKRRKGGGVKVIQNILVDGHNLAHRCFHAPGISELRDEQGRPTGAILGFLRSLCALRKRCPEARVYVAWDGSSKRRKAIYGEYKANRKPPLEGFVAQVDYLRAILPFCGVWQADSPDEEADDILAALVRGQLRDQHNLLFSTDRDLLSLVTETTSMLLPGAGSRKDVVHGPASIKKSFGVAPSTILDFRAFCGDTSDNLPGVPRVPKKVLCSLVKAYGSIDGVYGSGLAGVSKGQYERLRTAEPQVRLNRELMSLINVEVFVRGPSADAEKAAQRLREVNIDPTPLLGVLLG
jgi:5'-3' exonuclease/transcription antitermination factor NusG